MVVVPTADNIVIKFEKQPKEHVTKGGIVLASTAAAPEVQEQGEVVAVGSGRLMSDGTRVASEIKVGDMVIFNKFAGTKISDDEAEYLIVKENDILAIVK